MPVQVNQNSSAPASAAAPDGSSTFPLTVNAIILGGTVVAVQNPYPNGATPLQSSSGNVAAAAATATLTSAAGRLAYISGFDFSGLGATGASVVLLTIVGLLGGTRTYIINVPAGVTLAAAPYPLVVEFNPPLQASAANTNIVVSCPSLGVGNTNSVVNAQGYMV